VSVASWTGIPAGPSAWHSCLSPSAWHSCLSFGVLHLGLLTWLANFYSSTDDLMTRESFEALGSFNVFYIRQSLFSAPRGKEKAARLTRQLSRCRNFCINRQVRNELANFIFTHVTGDGVFRDRE
jgi:hypothetical protein